MRNISFDVHFTCKHTGLGSLIASVEREIRLATHLICYSLLQRVSDLDGRLRCFFAEFLAAEDDFVRRFELKFEVAHTGTRYSKK